MAQVDERAMAAREVTALRTSGSPTTSGHNSPTAAALLAGGSREFAEALLETGGGGLVRQGSMNLPKPEDSGVPATHPDMCILRIRRQHLLEVQTWLNLPPPCALLRRMHCLQDHGCEACSRSVSRVLDTKHSEWQTHVLRS